MSNGLTLTPTEVREATGAMHRTRQLAWFHQQGIPAALGVDGKVKVVREAYLAKMMPNAGSARTKAKTEPRLDLLRKAS